MGLYRNILVVGNGFDLALKLPTSYLHFMKSFLRYRAEQLNLPISRIEESDKPSLYESFADNMNLLKNSWGLTNNTDLFDEILLKNPFILLMIFKYNNVELSRAKNIRVPEISVEPMPWYPKFQDVPDLTEEYFKEHDIFDNDLNWFNVEEILHQISNEEEFCNLSNAIDKCKESCHVLTNLYGAERIFGSYDAYKEHKKYQELIEGFKLFKQSLAIYLFSVERFFEKMIQDNFKDVKRLFAENNYDEIISLNYTSFAERLFDVPDKFCHHPHGKISKVAPEKSEIVLGYYEDITKNRFETHYVEFQKFYQRILYGLGNYGIKDESVRNIELFGFSCDPADTELLKTLLLDKNDNVNIAGLHKVLVHCFKDKNQNILNLIQCIGKDNVLELTHQGKLEFKLDIET